MVSERVIKKLITSQPGPHPDWEFRVGPEGKDAVSIIERSDVLEVNFRGNSRLVINKAHLLAWETFTNG